jgi:hypothetical protein
VVDGGVTDASTDAEVTDASDAAIDSSTDAAVDAGFVLAYPYCADFQSDNQNCGGCGVVCGAAQTCKGGSCVNGCTSEDGGTLALCQPEAGAPYCADTMTDNENCGSCGNACPNKAPCSNGTCIPLSLVGSFEVSSGASWTTNPPIVTCQQECAAQFGGSAGAYSCSTSNTTITFTAWESCWGDGTHCFGGTPVAENYSVGTTNDECNAVDCYCSAYVTDHCSSTSVNYCWK